MSVNLKYDIYTGIYQIKNRITKNGVSVQVCAKKWIWYQLLFSDRCWGTWQYTNTCKKRTIV